MLSERGREGERERMKAVGECGSEKRWGGPGVHHGRGEDGHDGVVWFQHALLQHGSMLLHPPVQRDVVVLGPAAQRMEQENGPTVATLQQPLVGVLHQEGVAVVDRVTQLEGEDGVWGGRGGGGGGEMGLCRWEIGRAHV